MCNGISVLVKCVYGNRTCIKLILKSWRKVSTISKQLLMSDLSDESFESVQEEGESSHTSPEVQNVSILLGFCIKPMNIGATTCSYSYLARYVS